MEFRIILALYYVLLFYQEAESSVTVEKGGGVILECPGFVPSTGDGNALFFWYRASIADIHTDNRVAVLKKSGGLSVAKGDFEGRVAIDVDSGALEITETKITDDHYYSCNFRDTASGQILEETKLTITVTPSPQNLKISGDGQVKEGESVTYTCQASEVKPPPRQMYFKFMDDDTPLTIGTKENDTNADGLTWAVTVEYTLIANRTHQGKKLQCVFVTSTGENITSSEETVIQVLYKPMGTPSVQANRESAQVNSTITLTCDTELVDGSITYYKWQYANGTVIKNTTESTLEYKTASVGKISFICISGNSFGATNKSKPLQVVVLNIASTPDLVLIIGCCIGGILLVIFLFIGLVCYRRHKKLNDDSLEPDIQVNVVYNTVGEQATYTAPAPKKRTKKGITNGVQMEGPVGPGGEAIYAQPDKSRAPKKKPQENGEYGNLELGEGKAMSDDGLIYTTPHFAKPPAPENGNGVNTPAQAPSPAGRPTKPPKPKRHMDYTPVEYGELNFANMKKE